jgi:CheY-like chemotaxis protein
MTDMLQALKGKRILLVDDDRLVCMLVAEDLSYLGCEVVVARTFEEARARLESERFDVVLLDAMGVRGYELLAAYGRKFPCIVLTARARRPEDLEHAREQGAVLYVPKSDLSRLDIYIAKALSTGEPLWDWLFEFCDFGDWFGKDWRPPGNPLVGRASGGS